MNPVECKNLSCFKSLFRATSQSKKFLIVTIILILFYTCTGKYVTNNHFDYLIFSQRWLPTACIEYMEHFSPSDHHHCVKLKNFESWTIHGLWPTQNNHMGPFFCNRSLAFDINKLSPIESELKFNWPNIEGEKEVASLWQHEWEKHGTCAVQIELLNNELKYFSTTLKLFKSLNIQSVLLKNKILPSLDGSINITNLFNVIENVIGKVPQIHCIHEVKTKQPFLDEIRFCYSKNLELIDCSSLHNIKLNKNPKSRNALTNCPLNSKVIYPKSVISMPSNFSIKSASKTDYYNSLEKLLSIVRFLQWASI